MSSLQNKLYNYEQTPPEKVWDKIAAALDDSHLEEEFPSKLYNAEAQPPESAWDRIAGSLDAGNSPTIQLSQRRFHFLRYVAAALIIGSVSFAVIKLTGKNSDNSRASTIADKKQDSSDTKSLAKDNDTSRTPKRSPSIEQTGKNQDILAVTYPGKMSPRKTKARYTVSDNTDHVDASASLYALNEDAPHIADRYIMLMTPNGIIRMSKKWGDLVCCVSGQEQDKDCKDQIRKWQEKLACSSSSSTGNFMDILSLVSSLDSEL